MTAPAPGRDRWFDWDRDSIERFWRDAFALDLTPARLQRRMGPHLVAGLAARAAPPANVLLLGDRDPIFAETLLGAGFRVARAPLFSFGRKPDLLVESQISTLPSTRTGTGNRATSSHGARISSSHHTRSP
ncbi:MAG: hypothetical protein V3T66_08260 [Alphaproteobacteria bacterium]